jgi:DNA-binding helix-hairpin-helix protein with protein kinase domain
MANDPFPDPDVASAAANAPVFELDKVWALIDGIKLPNSFGTVPSHASYSPSGKPARKHGEGRHMVALGLVVLALVIGGYMVGLPWISLLAMVVGFFIRPLAKGYDGRLEVVERQASLSAAEREYNAAVTALNSGVRVPTAEFNKRKAQLQQTASALRTIPSQMAQEMSKIEGLARAYHLRKHLERFFIDDVRIRGLGPSRKASLKSFGIETAADVVEADVRQVKGFGGSLTQALLDWRASHERSFVFAAHMRPPASEVARLHQKERATRTPLEMELRKAPEVLKGLIAEAHRQHGMLMPRVETAAKALAQAHADLAEANLAMR